MWNLDKLLQSFMQATEITNTLFIGLSMKWYHASALFILNAIIM